MQLKDRDGIACDHCGTTYRTDFLYYSFDFRALTLFGGRRIAINEIFRSPVTFSLDICTACFDTIKGTVVKNYESTMISDVRKRGRKAPPFICELSGTNLVGVDSYHHCNVTRVNVKMSGQPYICANCQTQMMEDNKPCTNCEHTDFIRMASTSSDGRFVEINVGEEAFQELVHKAETIRKVAGEWATKS
jgi:hypothetical protein